MHIAAAPGVGELSEDTQGPRQFMPKTPAPGGLVVVLIGSAIWIGAMLVRGVTYAFTHAVHGL